MLIFLNIIGYVLFLSAMGYYFVTNLQWYNYKLQRVVFKHTKPIWHIIYLLVPYIVYLFLSHTTNLSFVFASVYAFFVYMWHRSLDKPLVFTSRVKRYFAIFTFVALFLSIITKSFTIFIPMLLAWFISLFVEKMLFEGYKKRAKDRLLKINELKVVGVTASYGKTSIKNFIAQLLSKKYNTYATPRSVNTLGGVIKDINEELVPSVEVYVVEMGARGKGDIAEISSFVEPHIAVVGKIGPAHIEYFKSIQNIRDTKMEIASSSRLQRLFVHESALVAPDEKSVVYGDGSVDTPYPATQLVSSVKATLDGVSFELNGERFEAAVLGSFNAQNLAVAILVAKELGMHKDQIAQALKHIEPIPHRLQRIDAGGKIILDDSFNGNIDGMMASFDLASGYEGRKVVITPGLVEVDEALNVQVAKRANEVFDLVVVTGDLNLEIFKKYVEADKLIHLSAKSEMEKMLVEETRAGDLILFANDAPSFV